MIPWIVPLLIFSEISLLACTCPKDLFIFDNHEELFEDLVSIIDKNTIILVKGSRSTRMDLIADKLKK